MSTHITREILKAASLTEQIQVAEDEDEEDEDEELGHPSGGDCVRWPGILQEEDLG